MKLLRQLSNNETGVRQTKLMSLKQTVRTKLLDTKLEAPMKLKRVTNLE
jgi:hypothetical protein